MKKARKKSKSFRLASRKSFNKKFKSVLRNLFTTPSGRGDILSFVIVLVFGVFFARLYFLQIVNGEYFRQKADAQNLGIVYDYFDRGNIYFKEKNGVVSVASINKTYSFAIDPGLVKDPEKLYEKISKIVEVDKAKFEKAASKKHDRYELILKQISKEQAHQLKQLNEKSIIITSKNKRFYPAGELASHVIGFVSSGQDGKIKGRYGLEKYWDDELSYDSSYVKKNFFASILLSFKDIKKAQKSNIYTTVHAPVQKYVESVLDEIVKKYDAEFAGAIIMEAKTGKIVAMATRPGFDLNEFSKYPLSAYPNKLTERVYELGSIVKPLTVAAGLDSGVITEHTTYNDKGFVVVDGHTIYNYDKKGRGPKTTIQDILSHSLNTGVVFITKKLGKDMFRSYFKDFGLMEETGIDLPYEASNLVSNLESPRFIEYATASFGQGIALTPISFVRAFGGLATGQLSQPYIVEAVETGLVKKEKDYQDLKKTILKPETVKTIAKLLTKNVDKSLAGGKYKLEHYRVAAKTGTAQIPDKKGGYKKDEVLHTFAGYFPSYNPEFVVFLMLSKPKGAQYSSESLPEPFFKIVKYLINYFQIPPDR